MAISEFKPGDLVGWQYTHAQGRSRMQRVKVGKIVAFVRHTPLRRKRHPNEPQLAWVQFEGNKRMSKVPVDSLRKVELSEA